MSSNKVSNFEMSNHKSAGKHKKKGKLPIPTTTIHGSDSVSIFMVIDNWIFELKKYFSIKIFLL